MNQRRTTLIYPTHLGVSTWRTALAAVVLSGNAALLRAETYSVGVVPQFPPLEIHRTWTPLLDRLGQITGHKFQLKQYASIPLFEKSFSIGTDDLLYLNPYHMTMAASAQHYVPLVRDGKTKLTGILVVRSDSSIKSLKDLNGATLAFPAPNAFGASLYLRAILGAQSIDIKPEYVKTHTNAYRHVLSGVSAAAGGIRSTLEREPAEVQQQLRVIYESPGVAPHPLAAHPRVPTAIQDAIRNALIKLAATPEGQSMLNAVQMSAPVTASYAADYAPLASLRLERFVVMSGK